MITTFILNAFLDIIASIFTLLPTGTALNINTLVGTFTSGKLLPALGWANNYFPLDEFGTLLSVALATWLITFLHQVRPVAMEHDQAMTKFGLIVLIPSLALAGVRVWKTQR